MDVYVCEDASVDALGPLVLARPACDLTIGAGSLIEMLRHFGRVHRVLRPHLQSYLTALGSGRIPLWGSPREAIETVSPRSPSIKLLVNARLIPSRTHLIYLQTLLEAGRPGIVFSGKSVAAAILNQDATTAESFNAIRDGEKSLDTIADTNIARFDVGLELLQTPADLLTAHEASLEAMLAVAIDSGQYFEHRPGLFLEHQTDPSLTPTVAAEVVVREGPILVDAGANIGPFCCLDGPIRIGRRTKVHPHSWIGPGTVTGHDCRLGGEITATVIESFSNKAHGGFVGHSHLGSWVNLAAGTITGNLKFSYGLVRLHGSDPTNASETGRQFFGSLIGDFTKTAIQTALPCGGLIGPAATLGGTVTSPVPAFTTQLSTTDQRTSSSVEQITTSLTRMMERRGLNILPADHELLATVARFTDMTNA